MRTNVRIEERALSTLVLVRHGESEGNALGSFTGWLDVGLTEKGRAEAVRSGRQLAAAGLLPDVVHTSLLRRAIDTANRLLDTCDRHWIATRRSWRLNERHYGALQGRARSDLFCEFGASQFDAWRRGYDVTPPPLPDTEVARQARDPRYADVPPSQLPRAESHAAVTARLLPYWTEAIAPDLRAGLVVCVVAHGNSLRALRRQLDRSIEGAGADIPTGIPLVYDLDADLTPTWPGGRYLDPDAATRAIAAIAVEGR